MPSPATVISIIALVFAVAGTALAGVATISVLSKKEKKQTRRIAKAEISKAAPGLSVKHAATADAATASIHAATADTATDSNQLGGKPAGDFQGRLWAVVRADGSLARGAGAISSSGAGGNYEVKFNRDITGCAFAATVGDPADGAESLGQVEAHIESLDNARDAVGVLTADSSGAVTARSFDLIVAC